MIGSERERERFEQSEQLDDDDIYIYIYNEMEDFGESDKMIKIIGKMDKSDTYKRFSSNISFFIPRISSDSSLKKFLNKELNITTKPFVSV